MPIALLCCTSCTALKEASNSDDTTEQETVFEDYYSPNEFEYKDKVYQANINTILFHPRNTPLGYPILNINENIQLELTFDDLGGDYKNYSYTIYHCNSDWTLSDLSSFDYVDGFTEDSIDDYRFSFNTLQSYTQYRLYIPNNRMQLTKTGNYLLVVYEGSDPENVVLSRRFMVFDNNINVTSNVMRPNITRYLRTHQRLSFTIHHGGTSILNPMLDLKVMVLQNGRWDNAIMNLKPQFIRRNELVYDYSDQSLFKAGKEFRFFGFRDLDFATERVSKIWVEDSVNHVQVHIDEKRHTERYSFWKDMNGQFLIGRFGGFTRVDADYAWVHFKLKKEETISNGNVYVFGAFCNWTPQEQFQMQYNYEEKAYEANIYLKQGVYNYQYVVWEDNGQKINDTELEGSYWETENNYLILIYHRPFNARYDQLIGVELVNSRR